MKKNWLRLISLLSQGSRYQLEVGIALVSIIPLLSFCFLMFRVFGPESTYSLGTQILIVIFAVVMGVGGYLILRKFPRNIVKLREYLKDIASGELPEKVNLLNSEDDINAIEKYLNMILAELRRKVEMLENQLDLARKMQKTIKAQADEIHEAERHRVMIESLGTACHYIGQPATVLRAYLNLLKKESLSAEAKDKIDECVNAAESIADILDKLRQISRYRTVPYQVFSEGSLGHEEFSFQDDDRILDIES